MSSLPSATPLHTAVLITPPTPPPPPHPNQQENIDGDEFQQIVLQSKAEQYLKNDAPGVSIPYQSA